MATKGAAPTKRAAGAIAWMAKPFMPLDRSSGLLLHISSLDSAGGIGDFGPAAYAFADFLAAAKQRLWQVLPLNPVGYGSSPYSSISAFAGNPLLISLETLVEWGWLTAADLAPYVAATGTHPARVDFEEVRTRQDAAARAGRRPLPRQPHAATMAGLREILL